MTAWVTGPGCALLPLQPWWEPESLSGVLPEAPLGGHHVWSPGQSQTCQAAAQGKQSGSGVCAPGALSPSGPSRDSRWPQADPWAFPAVGQACTIPREWSFSSRGAHTTGGYLGQLSGLQWLSQNLGGWRAWSSPRHSPRPGSNRSSLGLALPCSAGISVQIPTAPHLI